MHARYLSHLLLALAIGLAGVGDAAAQHESKTRVALIVGNAAYQASPLLNPRNDATAMAEALRRLGFEVVTVLDASQAQIAGAVSRAADLLKGADGVGLLYYSGHGVQLESSNFIVPIDARPTTRAELLAQGIDVRRVLDVFRSAGTKVNIVILDSCRENPFGALASGAGLVQMDAPSGTFIAFATAPGNVALDGYAADTNGIYTAALLKELKQAHGSIESVFKKVRFQVRQRTGGRQVPWESTSLEADFSLDLGPAPPTADAEDSFRKELAHWQRVSESRNVDDFYDYLQQHPGGMIAEKAQAQLEKLAGAPAVRPVGTKAYAVVPSDRPLFRVGDRFVYRSSTLAGSEKSVRDLVVTRLTASTVELNEGKVVWDWIGNLIFSDFITRHPAKIWIPTELFVGKRWRTAYSTRSDARGSTLFWDFRIEAYETVTVPAGSFEAFRVNGTSEISNGKTQTETLWIDAKTFLIVKDEWARKRAPRRGTVGIEDSYRRELLEVARAPV